MTVKVLVTGGTGFLGQYLARRLLREECQVYLGGRNFQTVQKLIEAGAIARPFDLGDYPATVAVCQDVDVVCHAGALAAPWGQWSAFYRANVIGTQAIIQGCRQYGVRRLVHISSPSVVFDGRDQINATDAVPYPRRWLSAYAQTKKISEELVKAAQDVNTIILRPKAIFGPGDRALLPRLIAAARLGQLPRIGNGQNQVDLTYVENVVDAIVRAMQKTGINGVYTITNNEHVYLWEVIQTVLNRLSIAQPRRSISPQVAMAAATYLEWQAVLTRREPRLTRYSVALLCRTQTYDISAAMHDLDYQPTVSVSEGIERTLQALTSI